MLSAGCIVLFFVIITNKQNMLKISGLSWHWFLLCTLGLNLFPSDRPQANFLIGTLSPSYPGKFLVFDAGIF